MYILYFDILTTEEIGETCAGDNRCPIMRERTSSVVFEIDKLDEFTDKVNSLSEIPGFVSVIYWNIVKIQEVTNSEKNFLNLFLQKISTKEILRTLNGSGKVVEKNPF